MERLLDMILLLQENAELKDAEFCKTWLIEGIVYSYVTFEAITDCYFVLTQNF